MTSANKNSIADPGNLDALLALKADIFMSMNCVKIGQIVSFDGAKKTARVQIQFKRETPAGEILSYPMLVDCPVFTLQGGGGAIQFPITAGDQCLLLFSDRNIDAWFKAGQEAIPFDGRAHDLSDGIALVGLNAMNGALSNYVASVARLFFAGAEIDLAAGSITIKAAASDAEIDLAAQIVTIKNATTTLLTLLNGLIDVISSATLDVGHATLTGATIAALNAQKIVLATLLG